MNTDTDAMTDRADEGKHTPLPCLYHADARILGTTWSKDYREFQARCECGARGPLAETQEAAVEAWNRLSTNALLVEKVARLERLVEQAYREGLNDAPNSSLRYNEDLTPFWLSSAARTALNASREGAQ